MKYRLEREPGGYYILDENDSIKYATCYIMLAEKKLEELNGKDEMRHLPIKKAKKR